MQTNREKNIIPMFNTHLSYYLFCEEEFLNISPSELTQNRVPWKRDFENKSQD